MAQNQYPTKAQFEALVREKATALGLKVLGVTVENDDMPGLHLADLHVQDEKDVFLKAPPLQRALHQEILQDVRVGYYQPDEVGEPAIMQIDLVFLADEPA